MKPKHCALFVLSLCVLVGASNALAIDSAAIDRLLMAKDIDVNAVKREGQAVMPILAALYKQTNDPSKRAKIAGVFYRLGWQSEAAKEAMMQDVHSDDRDVRLQVQWALGRVSSDDRIVNALLENMQDDKNPLFREKAACALASDQIHLTPKQHAKLLTGLIGALSDAKLDVRRNAVLALSIQTGQTKGFDPAASEAQRNIKIQEWHKWIVEYNANL